MVWASYRAPSQASQLKIRHGDRDAALVADPDPSRRGEHPWHRPPRHAAPPVAVNPGQHGEVWQDEGLGTRQRQQHQAQVDDMSRFLLWRNRAGRSRRQWKQQQHRRKRYFKRRYKLAQQEKVKHLMALCPCASSSNGWRRQRRQHRFPVRGLQHEQPEKARWQGHYWRNNHHHHHHHHHQQQRIEPLHQDQLGEQSHGGQEEVQVQDMKKCCCIRTLHLPAEMLEEGSVHLRPMNMEGFHLPGMHAPHNTSQYIMEQHEYPWRKEEEAAAAMSGGSSNFSAAGEDFPLMVSLPSTAQEDEGTSAEEEEEEKTQPAWQGWKYQDDIYRET